MNPRRRRHQRLRKNTYTHSLRNQFLNLISQANDASNYREGIIAAVKWAVQFVELGHLVKAFQKEFKIPSVLLTSALDFGLTEEEKQAEEKYLEFISKVPIPETSALATSSE